MADPSLSPGHGRAGRFGAPRPGGGRAPIPLPVPGAARTGRGPEQRPGQLGAQRGVARCSLLPSPECCSRPTLGASSFWATSLTRPGRLRTSSRPPRPRRAPRPQSSRWSCPSAPQRPRSSPAPPAPQSSGVSRAPSFRAGRGGWSGGGSRLRGEGRGSPLPSSQGEKTRARGLSMRRRGAAVCGNLWPASSRPPDPSLTTPTQGRVCFAEQLLRNTILFTMRCIPSHRPKTLLLAGDQEACRILQVACCLRRTDFTAHLWVAQPVQHLHYYKVLGSEFNCILIPQPVLRVWS